MRHDVDHAVEIAVKKALHIGFDCRQSIVDINVAEPALMRGDDDIRHRPEWMIDRQWLLAEYVKRRPGHEWKLVTGDELENVKTKAERTKTDPKWRQERLIKRDGELLVVKAEDKEKDDPDFKAHAREALAKLH